VLADTANVSNPFQRYSISSNYNLLEAIVKSKNLEMFKVIINYLLAEKNHENPIKRVKMPKVALAKQSTGEQNFIHHRFIMR
jgi:hypothetical protein